MGVSVQSNYVTPSQISSNPPPSNETSSTPAQVAPQNNVSSFPPPPQFNVSVPSNNPPPTRVSSLPPPPQFNISKASLPNNNAFSPSTPPVIPSPQHNFPPPTSTLNHSDQYN